MHTPRGISVLTVLMASSIVVAGPDWTEVGDAGKSTPQTVAIPIQPETITGALGGPLPLDGRTGDADGGFDVADLYDILITVPDEVMITTQFDQSFDPAAEQSADGERTGPTNFDTALWLFRLDRRGLLGNRDILTANQFSRILPISTDGTGFRIPGPGRYLLAVSYGDIIPVSFGGMPIFDFNDPPGPTQVSGPDGPGGTGGFSGWVPDGERPMVKYRIRISPRDCRPCPGDADGNHVVNFQDVTAVLSRFNSTCLF